MKYLDVERHVLDIEARPEPLHIEKARRLLVDAPKEPALARAHVHGRVHDPNHWQLGTRAIYRLRNDQLLTGGYQGHTNAAGLRDLPRPRTSSINNDRTFN